MTLWLSLQLAALVLVLVACSSIIAWTWRLGISPMPSTPKARAAILRWIAEHPPGPGLVLEPGAGWGSLAFPLAKALPNHQIIAYERSWCPWLWMKLRLRFQPRPNLQLRRKDLHDAPWSDASLVICYLFTGAMAKLQAPLAAQLPPEAWVLSNTFSLPHWTHHSVLSLRDLYNTKIYVYKSPASTPTHPGGSDARPTHTGPN